MRALVALAALASLLAPAAAVGQFTSEILPPDSVERLLRDLAFDVVQWGNSRGIDGERTKHVLLLFPDSTTVEAKWARAAPGAEEFNNQPRYELAAYALQRLFLDGPDYVVPPTVARAIPVRDYPAQESGVRPTFSGTESVIVILQYWLPNVTNDGVFDPRRLEGDSVYARYFGNLNLLTYLMRHSDANAGNVLISRDPERPRLFTVDNGIAFGGEASDRGTAWRNLRTNRLPSAAIDRLREVEREDLERALAVVAQFESRDGHLVAVAPTEPLSTRSGVRRRDGVIQLGLTASEISGVHSRLQRLLQQVERGRLTVF